MPRIRPRPSADPAAPGRRGQFAGTIVLGLLVAAASIGGLWTIYDGSRSALDREMGNRMLLIAEEIAAAASPDSLLQWAYQEPDAIALNTAPLRARVETIGARRNLNYVVVYSFEGDVLLDTSGLRDPGASDPFLFGDELEAAMSLEPMHVPTREVLPGQFLKSAFLPIVDPVGLDPTMLAHVAVHAAPDFFETLRTLRRTLFAVGAAVVLLLATAIGVYLFYAQRLARARAALARSEQLGAMGRMAAGIAHEIRNPLGIIKNTAQLLREEIADAGLDTGLVKYIPEEVDRLNETLTGYLEFAKEAPLRREPVDLVALCRRTLALVKRDLESAHVTAETNLDAVGDLVVDVDSRRMQQVVLNLVLNAVQAMPEGGSLRLTLDRSDAEVELLVGDSGVGMDATTAQQIFEPFFTSKEKGSGLGLHVVQRIVEDHGGRIELETEVGEGTTFAVVLPDPAAPGAREPRSATEG